MSCHGGQMDVEGFEQISAGLTHSLGENELIRLQVKKATSLPNEAKLPNEIERLAAIHVCRTSPSDKHIGQSTDEPNRQHVVRRIGNVDRNVEKDEECCCWIMERHVQTHFKPMYEVCVCGICSKQAANTQAKNIFIRPSIHDVIKDD